MEKRYQVFVSSTYADLKEERQRVIQALMEMDCIPSGMELFPAADEEQWEFIKRIIDDCDYYLLIIGGRYGSTTAEGVSYTEKEYDYAIEKGIKVVALLHANPDEIPLGKSEADPESRGRLKAFREKVAKDRLVRFWRTADELPGLVALSLSKTIKMYPAVGWIRANQASNTQLLNEINELRKRKDQLEEEIRRFRAKQITDTPDIATLDDTVEIDGTYKYLNSWRAWKITTTWGQLFALLSPYLVENPNDARVKLRLTDICFSATGNIGDTKLINDQTYQTIKIHLEALNLVQVKNFDTKDGGVALFWLLTDAGRSTMMSLRTVRKEKR